MPDVFPTAPANDDRRLSRSESQRRLLQAVFDSAPFLMGVVELRDGEVLHQTANEAATRLFQGGRPSGAPVGGATLPELGFSEDEAAAWRRHVEACAATGAPVHFQTAFPGGEGRRHLDVGLHAADGAGPLFAYVAEDVTEKRWSERERRLLATAVEQAADPIIVTDAALDAPGPRILYVNEAHARAFGYTAAELMGRSPRLFQGPKTDRAVLDRIRVRLEAGEPVQAETVNYRKDGSEFVLQWELAPVRDESGEVVNWVGTQRDVTERRELEREVLEVEAREQERMARDLHDGLGQVLTGAAFKLQALALALDGLGEDALGADARRTREVVESALGQARAIARGLFPIDIEPGGLPGALGRLAADAAAAYGIDCTFACDAPLRVESRERASHLYRIAQEALANAARHGRARSVAITVSRDGDAAELAVRDDGVGIPATALVGGEGLGLRTMRYRAERVGGALDVRQGDEGGTWVRVRFWPEVADA